MSTIYQELEAARTFADTMKLRNRIMAETSGDEQAGYLKSLDCLETVLDQMAEAAEYELEQSWSERDRNNPDYHHGF